MKTFFFLAATLALSLAAQNCSRPLDLVFVLDESGSIASTDFKKEKDFVINYANTFNFGADEAAMGVVQFATVSRSVIGLTQNKLTFVSGVNALSQSGGTTCLLCGINSGTDMIQTSSRTATRVMITLTDGQPNPNNPSGLAAAVTRAKSAGITLVAIGVGSGVTVSTLNQIASTVNGKALVYTSTSFSELSTILDSLITTVCVDIPPPPPTDVCGNGVIEASEECDGGECCDDACKFKASTVVCRAAAGDCDVAETCTGTTTTCPADKLKPTGTPCGEYFGLCDVRLEKTCTGNDVKCYGPPPIPVGPFIPFSWEDFNVISFDGFKCHGGDVEGRLASKNSVDLSGFSLGMELKKEIDGIASHSLFVGGDAKWTDGTLYPIGNPADDFNGEAFVGGNFDAPADLLARRSDPFDGTVAKAKFDDAQVYYTTLQNTLAALGENAAYTIQYSNGLLLTCSASADVYHVKISATDFNKVDWIVLSGCKFSARWIVDITGTEDVTIKGQPFPAIVERVIYNVLGNGRTITGATGVAAHILAPRNKYYQTGGVTYGKVIVGTVLEARQNNKPNCKTFSPVVLTTAVLKPVQLGDTRIVVVDLANFIAGDLVCINGNCQKLKAAVKEDIDGDGILDNVFTFENAFSSSIAANSLLSSEVDPNTDRNTVTPNYPTVNSEVSSAATLAAAFFLVLLALF